ncbi:MAG: Ig-like domain-containing protein [Oscillospiraceae bacterium]|nr:Ig-like domain-containing protein [Oscillospiraceae bacterium]
MSKICEKCGNIIPEGNDTCPSCGWVDYNDEALQSALEEMLRNLDSVNADEDEEASHSDPEAMGDTMMFDKELIRKAGAEKRKQPKPDNRSALGKEAPKPAAASEQAAEKPEDRQAEQPAIVLPAPGEGGNQPRQRQNNGQPRKKKPSSGNGTKSGSGSKSGKKGKKKKKRKKKNSNKVITIIIVILILLLLALGGACVMALNTMGFFDSVSEDELLLAPASEQEPMPTAASIEEPEAVSVEEPEETPASAEESGTYIPELEGVDTPAETEDVTCTKFSVTGASDLTLNARGETSQVVYVIQPEEAKANIEWESSDPVIASVDANGVILGRRGGYCTITGTCGEMSVTINVTCDFTVPSTVLDMNYLDITMSYEGQTVDLYIDYDLDEEQIKNTVWESSDPAVATVDSNGTVTAVADGTAVISASIGEYTASCIVRCVAVTGNRGYNNSNSEYAINYEDVTLTRKGEYFQLSLKSVLTNEKPTVTWSSSDTKVATVDSKGVVTAVANGTAEITTTIGEEQFRCIVRVNITG